MSSPQVFSHGHAVVVGIGNDLPMTVTDATALASVLTDPERCGYPAAQVKLLAGGAALAEERPTRANILAALDGLADSCRSDPDAIAIVYYSGHGGFRPEDGVYYLVPDGYDPNRFVDTTVTGADLAGKLAAVRASGVLVLLDCCHAAGLSSGPLVAKGGIRKAPLPPDLMALKGMTGRALVASCQANEESFGGHPYSFFTAALLEGLAGYGARQRDGKAHFIDVLGWIGHEVTKRTSDRQHPILDFSQVPINFPLAFYAGGGPVPKKLDWAGPVPQPADVPPPEARPLPALPESVRLIDALAELTEGQLASVARGLGIKPADLPRADLRAQAVEIQRRAGQDRSGQRLQLLRSLILNYNPEAFN
jgi:hypothetical protein